MINIVINRPKLAPAGGAVIIFTMFERFTERAVRVIMAAQEEAKRLGSRFVGSEQPLLGMMREGEPIVFKTLNISGSIRR